MRMMFEVQNGTVQSRNRPMRQQRAADMEDQEIRDPEADDQREQPGQNRELDGLANRDWTSAPEVKMSM